MNKLRQRMGVIIIFLVLGLFYISKISVSTSEENDSKNQVATVIDPTAKLNSEETDLPATRLTLPSNTVINSSERQLTYKEIKNLRAKAKSALATIYTAQKSFYVENSRYTSDLVLTGFMPDDRELVYKFGFANELIPNTFKDDSGNEEPKRKDSDIFLDFQYRDSGDKYYYSEQSQRISLTDFAKYCPNECKVTNSSFEMLLVLPIGNNKFDVWTINDKKVISQVADGLKEVQ